MNILDEIQWSRRIEAVLWAAAIVSLVSAFLW